ncbi:MAG: hypothetical protein U5L45_20135 [Saprospiraceae bacterium]|nr:hypothetical protein [Saprospiraceae bacterium]
MSFHSFYFFIFRQIFVCGNYLAYSSLRSQNKGNVVHFSGKARKMNHLSSLARAKRARD